MKNDEDTLSEGEKGHVGATRYSWRDYRVMRDHAELSVLAAEKRRLEMSLAYS